VAHPTCAHLSDACAACVRGARVHRGATYLAMEGPQFSTLAESRLYRAWGADVIGMTGMPEAKLAREAELCYACLAMVTDYDCWHEGHGAVDVAQVIALMSANVAVARDMLTRLPGMLGASRATCPQGCDHALDHAIMTAPAQRDADMLARMDAVAGRVLG
jgi:5'-methylthioadenosine phosphorylase